MSDDDFIDCDRGTYYDIDGDLRLDVEESAQLDTIFDILSHRRRRYLLYYLTQSSNEVAELSQLVDAVRTFETADAATEDAPTEKSITVDLHHKHLPRLDATGVIEYDARQGTVRYDGKPALVEWLEHAQYKEFRRTV